MEKSRTAKATMQIGPNTLLDEITSAVIEHLLQSDSDEGLYFDFKAGFDSPDKTQSHKVRKAFASFANAEGGFLFLGILDKETKKRGLDRVVGVSDTKELGKRITESYLKGGMVVPTLTFEEPRVLDL